MSGEGQVFATERHGFVEKSMDDLGISWETSVVSIQDVDLKDNRFQTRSNVSVTSMSLAREYADKVKDGESFPMVVLQEKAPGKFRIVAGRHRATAYSLAQNGKTAYEAYIVRGGSSDELLKALSARENNGNGWRQGNSETAHVCADILASMPTKSGSRCHRPDVIREVSARFGAHVTTVRSHYFTRLVRQHMRRVGVDGDRVPVTVLRYVWQWTDMEGWQGLAQAIAAHGTVPLMHQVVSEAKKNKLDATATAIKVREFAESQSADSRRASVSKDPATVTLEHLLLAHEDLVKLAPPQNLPEEQAEDISDILESIRLSAKKWRAS
jgi:hypothetical protein